MEIMCGLLLLLAYAYLLINATMLMLMHQVQHPNCKPGLWASLFMLVLGLPVVLSECLVGYLCEISSHQIASINKD